MLLDNEEMRKAHTEWMKCKGSTHEEFWNYLGFYPRVGWFDSEAVPDVARTYFATKEAHSKLQLLLGPHSNTIIKAWRAKHVDVSARRARKGPTSKG